MSLDVAPVLSLAAYILERPQRCEAAEEAQENDDFGDAIRYNLARNLQQRGETGAAHKLYGKLIEKAGAGELYTNAMYASATVDLEVCVRCNVNADPPSLPIPPPET